VDVEQMMRTAEENAASKAKKHAGFIALIGEGIVRVCSNLIIPVTCTYQD